MGDKSGKDTDVVKQADQENTTHPFTLPSSTPLPVHYFPPSVRQAAFYNSRSSSHSSIVSSHRGSSTNLKDAENPQSRPGTPLSISPESTAVSLFVY